MARRWRTIHRVCDGVASRGFSLVEVLVALAVFAVITVGVVPLLGAALRGAALSRSETVAQNAARQMMERVEGLKWHTAWAAKQAKVDLLDLFYPSATGGGYTTVPNPPGYPPLYINGPSAGIYRTTCPDAANPACGGVFLPSGYSMTVKAAFVKPRPGTTPQTYEIVTPAAGYAYNAALGADAPPAQLLDVNVAVGWSVNGRSRTFELRSLIGEHRFAAPAAVAATVSPSPSAAPPDGTAKLRATAKVDYVYQVQTGFSSSTAETGCPTPPCTSDLNAVIGQGTSTIQAGDNATADSAVRTGDISVVRSYTPSQVPPASPPPDLANLQGISKSVHAPPTAPAASFCTPPTACSAERTIAHPDFGANTAGLAGTRITSISADVPNGNPTTAAAWQVQTGTVCIVDSWVWNPQADLAAGGYLRLDSASPTRALYHQNSGSSGICQEKARGTTNATAAALTPPATRAVTAKATADHSFLSLLKYNYSNKQPVFQVSDFTAVVDCKATPNGGAYATASWTAAMSYKFDNTDNNNVPASILGAQIAMSDTGNDTITAKFDYVNTTTITVPDAFAWLKANNPLVYDGNGLSNDIYLMNDPAAGKKGYIDSLTANRDPVTSVSADGRTVRASIDGALRIDTNQLHATIPDTALNVSIGKLSCEAIDNR